MWQTLNRQGAVYLELDSSKAADQLFEAIIKKAKRIPAAQRSTLVLALDANRIPSHTFQQVLDKFRHLHHETCKSYGFAQIWVIGAVDDLVSRLDEVTI